ncbi:MAG: zinc-binding alcohol dehydrogenase [Hyphomicrobiales bacterium]|nr:zinc-binding alcohol dehydrogenase [Hyphomicrobiales bacterium]
MKAIVIREFGPPEVLRYEELPDPQPRAGEIRVVVHAATVNRVLDVAVRRGEQAQRGVELPLIPGVDCAGVVDAIGPGVTVWKVGDRVCAAGRMPLDPCAEGGSDAAGRTGMMGIKRPGGFAEKVCVPASVAFALPDGLGFHEAAVVMRHCPTAWNLLVNIAALKAGEWALIMGASGNLGSVGIQIAKHVIGAKVIAVAGTRGRADMGLALGADYAIDYGTQDLRAEVMRITGGKGVDVLYDNIANPKVLPDAFHAIGENGRLVTAGAHGGPNVMIDFFHLYDKKITIRGMPGSRDADRPKCFAAAAEGKIKVQIAHVLPLSRAAEAHRMMERDPGMGKIVLDPSLG